MSMLPRLTLVTLTASLLLAACSDKTATRTTTTSTTTPSHSTSTVTTTRTVDGTATTTHRAGTAVSTSKSKLPDHTGIQACDDYLASYMACHRAAGIFPPAQLPQRYEAMRNGLLRDSMNPDIRPQLGARCNSLASDLRTSLHGKPCDVAPASSSTTP